MLFPSLNICDNFTLRLLAIGDFFRLVSRISDNNFCNDIAYKRKLFFKHRVLQKITANSIGSSYDASLFDERQSFGSNPLIVMISAAVKSAKEPWHDSHLRESKSNQADDHGMADDKAGTNVQNDTDKKPQRDSSSLPQPLTPTIYLWHFLLAPSGPW